MSKAITGFSKLSKRKKLRWLVETFFKDPELAMRELTSYWLPNEEQQRIIDGFSENTVSNYYLPYGVAPNFLINGKLYAVPMVTEESSVVAAAASAAKYWLDRGGFKAEVMGVKKVGQVHFLWEGNPARLFDGWTELRELLIAGTAHLTANMRQRGGGILTLDLIDGTRYEPHYFKLKATFDTCDSMGANFINSILEEFGSILKKFVAGKTDFSDKERELTVVMAILSNYTPECWVRAWVECPIAHLGDFEGMDAYTFAEKFRIAIKIAEIDVYRATTHNKGIFNGIDAVVIATANDFRAIEACGHTYAARDGQYTSLSHCSLENDTFRFWLDIPLAVGTVGGLTKLHPIARHSFELLGNPTAPELMCIIAATGLAQNFAAVKSLVTTGIQKGHMKMHLQNILQHLQASAAEIERANAYFAARDVSFAGVRDYLQQLRETNHSLSSTSS